jgi:hypothetical protein
MLSIMLSTDFYKKRSDNKLEMRREFMQFLNRLANFTAGAREFGEVRELELKPYELEFEALVKKFNPVNNHPWTSHPLLERKTLAALGAAVGFFATAGIGGVVLGGLAGGTLVKSLVDSAGAEMVECYHKCRRTPS